MTNREYLEILQKEFLIASDKYLEIHSLLKKIDLNSLEENSIFKNYYLSSKFNWQLATKKLEKHLDKMEKKEINPNDEI